MAVACVVLTPLRHTTRGMHSRVIGSNLFKQIYITYIYIYYLYIYILPIYIYIYYLLYLVSNGGAATIVRDNPELMPWGCPQAWCFSWSSRSDKLWQGKL